ncbi:MAG: IS630 family transposase [Bacteroidota bacterium]
MSFRAVQRLRDDIVAEREAFAKWQGAVDGARIICVDESGIVAGGRVRHGYAPRGQRCEEHAPYRKGRRRSLIGWVGLDRGGVVAVEGSVDGDLFERFVREHLSPRLRESDLVVWDNHSIHKRPNLRELIRARGADLVWQPRYSPEFNACEEMWSKVKRLVRRARADTETALSEALRVAVRALTWEDAAGWLRHAGYVPIPTE